MNQLVAARTLENMGYRVDVVADGAEAVAAVMRGGYAAVLMDWQMPGLDGYEATAEIRRREGHRPRTPIIAMTAAAGPHDEARCVEAGMDAYLAKPVRSAVLDEVLQRWIQDVVTVADVPASSAAVVLDAATLEDLQALHEQEPEGVVGLVLLFLRETRQASTPCSSSATAVRRWLRPHTSCRAAAPPSRRGGWQRCAGRSWRPRPGTTSHWSSPAWSSSRRSTSAWHPR